MDLATDLNALTLKLQDRKKRILALWTLEGFRKKSDITQVALNISNLAHFPSYQYLEDENCKCCNFKIFFYFMHFYIS